MKIDARRLGVGEEQLVLDFLNLRPLKNVTLIGFVREHGLESPNLRGSFYGCFRGGRLIGVALIGCHVVLCGSHETIPFFACIARLYHPDEPRMVVGDEEAITKFRDLFGEQPCQLDVYRSESQHLYALTASRNEVPELAGLRPAQVAEIDEVAQAHARAFLEQVGIDPLTQDPEGFRQRVLSRIERGRVWVVRDDLGVAFKADLVAETDEAVYLEGIWTRPDLRGAGLGSTILKALCQRLLRRCRAVCLAVDAEAERTLSFYQRLGFVRLVTYHVIRYRPANN